MSRTAVFLLLAASLAAAKAHGGGDAGPTGRALLQGRSDERTCKVGNSLSQDAVVAKQNRFYANTVARFGADSAVVKAFVPPGALPAAISASASAGGGGAGAASGAAVRPPPDAATLDALVARSNAFAAPGYDASAAPAAGGRRKLLGAPTSIPVYVHAITRDGVTGYLNDTIIQLQMDTLSTMFAPYGFQFTLANTTRHVNASWWNITDYGKDAAVEFEMKRALRQASGPNELDLYITELGGGLGGRGYACADYPTCVTRLSRTQTRPGPSSYASFPEWYARNPVRDGIGLHWECLPGLQSKYTGAILVHEVGHWLGLYHTFQGGCRLRLDRGDMVADTPAEKTPNFGACVVRDTCRGRRFPGNDPTTNYMDYSTDACKNNFTPLQAQRMTQQWTTYRA